MERYTSVLCTRKGRGDKRGRLDGTPSGPLLDFSRRGDGPHPKVEMTGTSVRGRGPGQR